MQQILLSVAFTLFLLSGQNVAWANEADSATTTIENIWARPTRANGGVTAVYMDIKNPSDKARTLVKVTSPIGHAMIHQSVSDGKLVRMQHLDKLSIPAKSSVYLKPGSYHVMITGIKQPLKVGDQVKLSLAFEDAVNLEVSARVQEK